MWSRQLIMSNSTITKSYWYTRNQTNLYIGVKPSSRHSLDHVHLFDLAWYMTYLFEGNAFPFYEAPTSASQLFYLSRNNTECGTLYSGFPLCNNLSGLSTHCWGNWHLKLLISTRFLIECLAYKQTHQLIVNHRVDETWWRKPTRSIKTI